MKEILENVRVFAPRQYDNTSRFSSKTAELTSLVEEVHTI